MQSLLLYSGKHSLERNHPNKPRFHFWKQMKCYPCGPTRAALDPSGAKQLVHYMPANVKNLSKIYNGGARTVWTRGKHQLKTSSPFRQKLKHISS